MVPRAGARRWDAGCVTERIGPGGAEGGRWGAVGGVGRGGGGGAEWGADRAGVGGPPPRGPPGVGEERQVVPRGGGGLPSLRRPVLRRDPGPSRGEGGWGPNRSSRGEGGSFGGCAGPASAGGGVPWDHDSVGIPSLSMSA